MQFLVMHRCFRKKPIRGGGGVALEQIFFFGQSERYKKIGTDQFFWGHFLVAHEATHEIAKFLS